jgi:hypothetical protein
MQEVGLRILGPTHGHQRQGFAKRRSTKKRRGVRSGGQPPDDLEDEPQFGAQTPREDYTALRARDFDS